MNKKIINKKEKGSAIILSLLLLVFFMALSMNMFFMSRRKLDRAIVKMKGTTVLSNIEGGTSIGQHELKLASDWVTMGYCTIPDGYGFKTPTGGESLETITYTLDSGATYDVTYTSPGQYSYINDSGFETVIGTSIAGIALNRYNDYFTKQVIRPNNGNPDYVTGRKIDNGVFLWDQTSEQVKIYNVTGAAIGADIFSIGGYKIISITNGGNTTDIKNVQENSLVNGIYHIVYEKRVSISGSDTEKLENVNYVIQYEEDVTIADENGNPKSNDGEVTVIKVNYAEKVD